MKKEWQQWVKENGEYKYEPNIENHDTIGMLALDDAGNLLIDHLRGLLAVWLRKAILALARRIVIGKVPDLVVKPIDGYHGARLFGDLFQVAQGTG